MTPQQAYVYADEIIKGVAPVTNEVGFNDDEIKRIADKLAEMARLRQEIEAVCLEADARGLQECVEDETFVTFEADIEYDDEYHDPPKWYFIANLSYTWKSLIPAWGDNYDVLSDLKSKGLIPPGTECDPESCCSYFYFSTELMAREFIANLNSYLLAHATGEI